MGSQEADIAGILPSKSNVRCKFMSACMKGDNCAYSHDRSLSRSYSESTVCYYYSRDKCRYGENCYFGHEHPNPSFCLKHFPQNSKNGTICFCPRYLRKREKCNFFSKGLCTRGDDCLFMHETSKKVCAFYSHGICRYGKACRNAHIENDFTEEKNCGVHSPDKRTDRVENSISIETDKGQTINETICVYSLHGICRYGGACRNFHFENGKDFTGEKNTDVDSSVTDLVENSISIKIDQEQTIKNSPICVYYLRGACRYGDLCRRNHNENENGFTEENNDINDKKNYSENSISSGSDEEQTFINITASTSVQEASNSKSTTCSIESSKNRISVSEQKELEKLFNSKDI